jgi:hypothetical protein
VFLREGLGLDLMTDLSLTGALECAVDAITPGLLQDFLSFPIFLPSFSFP